MSRAGDEARKLAARAFDDAVDEHRAVQDALIRAQANIDKGYELIALAARLDAIGGAEHEQ